MSHEARAGLAGILFVAVLTPQSDWLDKYAGPAAKP